MSYGGAGYGSHEPARSVEHQLSRRCAACSRPRRRRSGDAEGAGLRFALPEPGKRAQHVAVRRQGERRRFLLHDRRRRPKPGRPDARRRPAQLRLDDLRRPQEHDLRRRLARRSAREGGLRVDSQALHARRKPRHGRQRACTTTTTRSPRRWPRSATIRSPTPTANRTTGAPSSPNS